MLVQSLAAPLLIHLPANEAAADGPNTWVPVILKGDPEVSGFWVLPGPALATAEVARRWKVNQKMENLSFSVTNFQKNKYIFKMYIYGIYNTWTLIGY